MQSDSTVILRMPKNLHDRLKAAAAKDHRSLNSFVRKVLDTHVVDAKPIDDTDIDALFPDEGETK